MTLQEFEQMRKIISTVELYRSENFCENLFRMFEDNGTIEGRDMGELDDSRNIMNEGVQGSKLVREIANGEYEKYRNIFEDVPFNQFTSFMAESSELHQNVSMINTSAGNNFKDIFKAEYKFDAVNNSLKAAKTTFNSSEYNALINSFNELLDIKNGSKKNLYMANDPHEALVNKIVEINEMAENYMKHKAKDGIKPNAYGKMDAVIDLYEFCQKEINELDPGRLKASKLTEYQLSVEEKIDDIKGKVLNTAILDSEENDPMVNSRRNLYLAKFSPNEKTAKNWFNANERKTERHKENIEIKIDKEK